MVASLGFWVTDYQLSNHYLYFLLFLLLWRECNIQYLFKVLDLTMGAGWGIWSWRRVFKIILMGLNLKPKESVLSLEKIMWKEQKFCISHFYLRIFYDIFLLWQVEVLHVSLECKYISLFRDTLIEMSLYTLGLYLVDTWTTRDINSHITYGLLSISMVSPHPQVQPTTDHVVLW